VTHRKTLHEGRILTLTSGPHTLPDGRTMQTEIVHHPGGAAAVLVDGSGRVCMLRQYRPAVDAWLWELPAGRLEPGEPPLETARRESEEEAGVRATQWESLGHILSSPGFLTEVIHLYLARDLQPGRQQTEPHELLEVHWQPFEEALEAARTGTITDAKTVIGLFRAADRL